MEADVREVRGPCKLDHPSDDAASIRRCAIRLDKHVADYSQPSILAGDELLVVQKRQHRDVAQECPIVPKTGFLQNGIERSPVADIEEAREFAGIERRRDH